MRRSYSTLSRAHKRTAYNLGYPKKLECLQDATDVNSVVTNSIAELARREFEAELGGNDGITRPDVNVGRVRESLKHFVRDWSEEGKEERDRMFKPILDIFQEVDEDERLGQKVLVPGCGLGRLAWEISQLGYDTTANELSYFITFALRFLLSPTTTETPNEHVIRPYAHWFSHQRTIDSAFRSMTFPDVVPRLSCNFHLVEQDFLLLTPPSTPPHHGYHNITTLFFIDTSLNAIQTIAHIYALLRPGGTWINLGPLLWTGGAQAKVELSLEEVIALAQSVGFIFDGQGDDNARCGKTVRCEYTADKQAMMEWIYLAEFWVARKPK